ncbi:cytochrome c oxidase assembly protein COX18, mitochondrial isoform X2 [Hyperolius riggenbachi]
MFCHSLKNFSFWTKSSKFQACVFLHPRRCLYERTIGPAEYKCRKQRLGPFAQNSSSMYKSCSLYGMNLNPALHLHLITPTRNVTAATFVAASAGQVSGGHGVYATLADSAPVHLAESMLMSIQEATGLPWWANILCTTIVLRTAVTLPLAIYQHYILAKVENLQSEIKNLAKELNHEVLVYGKQHGWNEKVAKFHFQKNMKRIITQLYVRDNCHPVKASLIMWIQIPMWVFVSLALRNVTFNPSGSSTGLELQRQLQEGGALWFSDLTLPDSTWILPISMCVINLLITEIFALQKIDMSKFQRYITIFIRTLCIVMIPIAASVPSSMAFYWVSSSFVGLTHNLLLRSPTARRLLRIPRLKADSDTPYKDLLAAFTTKYLKGK